MPDYYTVTDSSGRVKRSYSYDPQASVEAPAKSRTADPPPVRRSARSRSVALMKGGKKIRALFAREPMFRYADREMDWRDAQALDHRGQEEGSVVSASAVKRGNPAAKAALEHIMKKTRVPAPARFVDADIGSRTTRGGQRSDQYGMMDFIPKPEPASVIKLEARPERADGFPFSLPAAATRFAPGAYAVENANADGWDGVYTGDEDSYNVPAYDVAPNHELPIYDQPQYDADDHAYIYGPVTLIEWQQSLASAAELAAAQDQEKPGNERQAAVVNDEQAADEQPHSNTSETEVSMLKASSQATSYTLPEESGWQESVHRASARLREINGARGKLSIGLSDERKPHHRPTRKKTASIAAAYAQAANVPVMQPLVTKTPVYPAIPVTIPVRRQYVPVPVQPAAPSGQYQYVQQQLPPGVPQMTPQQAAAAYPQPQPQPPQPPPQPAQLSKEDQLQMIVQQQLQEMNAVQQQEQMMEQQKKQEQQMALLRQVEQLMPRENQKPHEPERARMPDLPPIPLASMQTQPMPQQVIQQAPQMPQQMIQQAPQMPQQMIQQAPQVSQQMVHQAQQMIRQMPQQPALQQAPQAPRQQFAQQAPQQPRPMPQMQPPVPIMPRQSESMYDISDVVQAPHRLVVHNR